MPPRRLFFGLCGHRRKQNEEFVASGASDSEVGGWIRKTQTPRSAVEIIKWNNKMREWRISQHPDEVQEFLEGYIHQFVPKDKVVRVWFDVYDFEEGRF